jgi:hypothetical protein
VWTYGGSASVQVNVDENGYNIVGDAANEPSIAVDPTNPSRMAIGWRQFDTTASNFRQAGWGYTRDGGRSWTFPGVIEPGVFRSDPVLDFDADGNFYYDSLTSDDLGYRCKVFKSTDGGATWDAGVDAYGGDKQWMAIDRTGGIGHGHVYHAWDYAGCCGDDWFSRSIDGAQTFELPVPIPDQPIWGVTTVGPDGAVYVAGRRYTTNEEFVIAKSTSARDPLLPVAFDFASAVDLGGVHHFYMGEGPNPGGLMGQIWVATDHSGGPTHGNVYVLCSVDPPDDDPMEVHFVRSVDGGLTFSSPVRVNDDPIGSNAWQWFGTMSVAPTGRIDVIFNDTRNDPGGYGSQLYYSFSTDAGVTWSANVPLSPPFDPHLGWPDQNKLGDYYDMVSDRVGANVAYAATFNGEQDVYYLRIGDYDCNANGVGDTEDIASGASMDVNLNGVPDECDIGACCDCGLGWGCIETSGTECDALGGGFVVGKSCAAVSCPASSPTNDDEVDAISITNGIHAFNTICATDDGPSPTDCETGERPFGSDIWYTYTADCDGELLITLCDDTDYDAIIEVYPDGADFAVCPMRCADDTCGVPGGPPLLHRVATWDQVFTIRIGGVGGAQGAGQIEVSCLEVDCPPGTPVLAEPDGADKNRYLAFAQGPYVGGSQAIRVLPVDLPPAFDDRECEPWWVGEPLPTSEGSGSPGPPFFNASPMVCNPYYDNWEPYGNVYVYGEALRPNATYAIQAVDSGCGPAFESVFSLPLYLSTSAWGDVVGDCAVTPCTPPNGVVDFLDISAIVEKFKNSPNAIIKARADLVPRYLDRVVDFTDIGYCVDAFRGEAYPYDMPEGCP